MAYEVHFRGKGGKPYKYKPKGTRYQCDEAEARDRFRCLLDAGKQGKPIHGIVPWLVTIIDTEVEPPPKVNVFKLQGKPEELVGRKDNRVRLAMYTDDEEPVGEWAAKAVLN